MQTKLGAKAPTKTGTDEIAVPERIEQWRRYWRTRNRDDRNVLVLAYEPIVRIVAARLPGSIRAYWELEDLCSFAMVGLVDAIERFAPDSPLDRFPGYAKARVRGAIYDELRRLDWLPRMARSNVVDYRSTMDALSLELGRNVSSEEVLASMGVSKDGRSAVLADVQRAQLLHLEHGLAPSSDTDGVSLVDRIVSGPDDEPEERLLATEQLAEVRQAVTELPERQRVVVTLHFLAGLTQEQIASMLGVTNSRVCQIVASAVLELRRIMSRGGADENPEALLKSS